MSNYNRTFRTSQLSDKQIVDLFDKLTDQFSRSTITFFLLQNMPIPREGIDEITAGDSTSRHVSTADFVVAPQNFYVYFRRGISREEHNWNVRVPSAFYDEIILVIPQNPPQGQPALTTKEITDCLSIIQESIHVIEFDEQSTGLEPKDLLTNQISGITRVHEKILTDAVELRRKLEDDRIQWREEDEAETKLLKQKLEDLYQEKLKTLEEEKSELESQKKSVDDRAYTYARRADRKRITDEIKEQLATPRLSTSTLKQLAMVYGFLGIGFIVAVAAAIWTSFEITNLAAPSVEYWVAIVRLSVLSSAAFGFLFFAVQWARRIYTENARSERELERYSFDLNRASWAIETILEAKKENASQEPPSEWIEGVCNNLFTFNSGDDAHDEDTSMNAFAELLKVAAEAKIGTDGASLKFDNRGTTKIAKSNQ